MTSVTHLLLLAMILAGFCFLTFNDGIEMALEDYPFCKDLDILS